MALERLQKIISAAGIASRRAAEELITSGRVEVNGKMVTELGAKAEASSDRISVNGRVLQLPRQHMYLMLNKPKGYVTTVSDPEGRPTVMDLLPPDCPRVYPVGRLDYLTEGLLLFTNDGDLAYKLMHASSKVPKTYLVKVAGEPTEEDVERLRRGVRISKARDPEARAGHVKTAPAEIRWVKHAENPWLEVTLIEGRNRQIRKMFEEVGHHIEKIKRIRYGPLSLDLDTGVLRSLKLREVVELKQAVGILKRREEPRPAERPRVERKPSRESRKPRFDRERPRSGHDRRTDSRDERPRHAAGNRDAGWHKRAKGPDDARKRDAGWRAGPKRQHDPRKRDERRPNRPKRQDYDRAVTKEFEERPISGTRNELNSSATDRPSPRGRFDNRKHQGGRRDEQQRSQQSFSSGTRGRSTSFPSRSGKRNDGAGRRGSNVSQKPGKGRNPRPQGRPFRPKRRPNDEEK